MTKKKQEQKGWAIYNPHGNIFIETIRFRRYMSIKEFLQGRLFIRWKECQKHGWTCRKVVIREIQMKIKSSYDFLLWYFNDLMMIFDESFEYQCRGKELLDICNHYKTKFRLHGHTNVQIFKIIKSKYFKEFDQLLYDDFNH